MCKLERKNEDTSINNSIYINNSSELYNNHNTSNNDLENSMNKFNNQSAYEDELAKSFAEHLEQTRKNIENAFLSCGKEQFIKMMKDRGEKVEENADILPKGKINKSNRLGQRRVDKNIVVSKKSIGSDIPKHSANYVTGFNEYDYSDEDIKEDDKKVNEEYDQIVNSYKKRVI